MCRLSSKIGFSRNFHCKSTPLHFSIMQLKRACNKVIRNIEEYAYSKQFFCNHENFLKLRVRTEIFILGFAAENAIRPFAVVRRGDLFANTPRGIEASAVSCSIVETAKANNLNVFQYINYLFKKLSNIDFKNKLDLLEYYIP